MLYIGALSQYNTIFFPFKNGLHTSDHRLHTISYILIWPDYAEAAIWCWGVQRFNISHSEGLDSKFALTNRTSRSIGQIHFGVSNILSPFSCQFNMTHWAFWLEWVSVTNVCCHAKGRTRLEEANFPSFSKLLASRNWVQFLYHLLLSITWVSFPWGAQYPKTSTHRFCLGAWVWGVAGRLQGSFDSTSRIDTHERCN